MKVIEVSIMPAEHHPKVRPDKNSSAGFEPESIITASPVV